MFYSMNLDCAVKGTVDGGTVEIKARETKFGIDLRPGRCTLQTKPSQVSSEQVNLLDSFC